jgi:hypothetical protein
MGLLADIRQMLERIPSIYAGASSSYGGHNGWLLGPFCLLVLSSWPVFSSGTASMNWKEDQQVRKCEKKSKN